MAAVAKVSVAMQKQILELHLQGMTARKIAKVLKVSRNTIRRIVNNKCLIPPGPVVPPWAEVIDIINPSTGEVTATSLCCGVMAMSSYTFGEFTLTQKRDDLIGSMENAFRYFVSASTSLFFSGGRRC